MPAATQSPMIAISAALGGVAGAGGIGSAICRRFTEAGAVVAVFDLNAQAASALVGEIEQHQSAPDTLPKRLRDKLAAMRKALDGVQA